MKAGIKMVGEEVKKEAKNEKRRIRSSGGRADTDSAFHFDLGIQTSSDFVCIRCGSERKRRYNLR